MAVLVAVAIVALLVTMVQPQMQWLVVVLIALLVPLGHIRVTAGAGLARYARQTCTP